MTRKQKLQRLLSAAVLVAVVFAGFPLLTASAGSQTFGGMTATTPDTYASCSATSDQISITGVPAGLRLDGWVRVEYVLNGSRQLVSMQDVDFTGPGDLLLTVSYPPIHEWPVQSNGTAEIHVDLAIEVWDNGTVIHTFGPDLDWDVFCLDRPTPTPPPPTPTPTPPPPTPTPTATPPPFEGCTPGYWKNHEDAWAATGFSPAQSVGSVFANAAAYSLAGDSLLDALSYGGGPGALGGARNLLRAAVAALLNAGDPTVDYPLTTAQVIAQTNAALASGNRATMLTLAATLDTANNAGCPLN